MVLKIRVVMVSLIFVAGCTAAPTKFLYRDKDDSGDKIYYISKDVPSFIMALPGGAWRAKSVDYNHTVLTSTAGPRKLINIFEYDDGLLYKRFYKPGTAEEQALEEYYRVESAHHLSEVPESRSEILARNLPAVNRPNLLWKLDGSKGKVVWLTTS